MIYEIGDRIYKKDEEEYFKQCVSMEYLHSNIRIGDRFLTYRDTFDKKISEFEFLGFIYCQWNFNSYGSAGTCNICKGYLKRNGGRLEKQKICPGHAQSQASCILKIIKMKYLKDELFEI